MVLSGLARLKTTKRAGRAVTGAGIEHRNKTGIHSTQHNVVPGAVCLGQTQGDQPMRASSPHLQRGAEALLGYLRGSPATATSSDAKSPTSGLARNPRRPPTALALRRTQCAVGIHPADSVIDEDERAEHLEWCADLSLDTNPAYELIDMATRQLRRPPWIQSDGKVTEDEVYGLRIGFLPNNCDHIVFNAKSLSITKSVR